MSRAQAIWGAVEVSSKILDCADVGTCGMLSVITALEFFQHYFAKMGHRNTSCDPHLHQVIEQPMLPTSREASAARAATSKRPSVDRTNQLRVGRQPSGEVFPRLMAAMKRSTDVVSVAANGGKKRINGE